MTNFEWIVGHKDATSLGHSLCDLMDKIETHYEDGCDICPLKNKCSYGKNAFIEWLTQEHEE